jgi:sugar phosphate isomerase/epimerase
MRIACSTSAFHMPLGEALEEIKVLGFEYVDLICIPGLGHIIPADLVEGLEDVAAEVERMLAKAELTPIAVNSAFGSLYTRDDAAGNAERLAQVEAVAALAQRFDVRVASFFPGGNWPAQDLPWSDVLAGEIATVTEMLAIGAGHDVTFAIEPHYDTPFQTVEQVRMLLDAAPALQIVYDPSHFAMQSIALEDTFTLLERAAHVHLRDAAPEQMQVPTGTGTVDFGAVMAALKDHAYAGDISIEYLHGLEDGPAKSIDALRGLLREG